LQGYPGAKGEVGDLGAPGKDGMIGPPGLPGPPVSFCGMWMSFICLIFSDRISEGGNAIASIYLSVCIRPFVSTLSSKPTELLNF